MQALNYKDALAAYLEKFQKDNGERLAEVLKTTTNASIPGTGTAFQPFNLDMVGKLLLPLLTPLQNRGAYGVKAGNVGDSREYRAIVAKNTSKQGGRAAATTSSLSTVVATAGRAGTIDYTFLTKKKVFEKFAPESAITWELYKSSGPFNALGKATIASLITAKELEERHIVGACSTALGTTATPTGTPSNSGGVLTNAASPYVVGCVALNYYGWWYYGADGLPTVDLTNTAGQIPTQAIGANSAGITIAAGTTGSIAMVVAAKKGAWAYLWIINHSAGGRTLAAVSTIPKVTLTAEGTVTASTLSTVDGSTLDVQGNTVVWDGLYAQIVLDSDIPGAFNSLAGAALTPTGAGSGVTEVETILANLATFYHISPDMAIMSPGTLKALSNIALSAQANSPEYRLNIDANGDGGVKAGTMLKMLRNQYMQTDVEIVAEPIMPDGKIIFYTKNIDYPEAGVNTNLELHTSEHFLQDFYARMTDVAPPGPWAIKTYGAPTLYWPKSCAVIDDILT